MRKRIVAVVMIIGLVALSGCATGLSQTGVRGAEIGGVIGGVTGALVDHRNPWRGTIIGATAGAVTMGTVGELSAEGAREARQAQSPQDDGVTHCRKVHHIVTSNGQVVSDRVTETCDSVKTEQGY